MKCHLVEGVMGNREVPRIELLRARADLGGAWSEARPGREGGSRGKHGFLGATEPKAKENIA
jgi:hypothetical protein